MFKRKGPLQTASQILGVVSFLLALVCGGWLALRLDEFGANNPISASLMASIFLHLRRRDSHHHRQKQFA